MSDQFIAEIRIFAGTFAPFQWAFCNGQVLPIQQNAALFSILGTTYGGNGTTNFALPNLQGRTPLGAGQGPALSQRQLGQPGGESTVTLTPPQLASHTHTAQAANSAGINTPAGNVWGEVKDGRGSTPLYAPAGTSQVTMNAQALGTAGGNQSHNNLQPFLTLSFIIALQGVFPQRP